MQITGTGTPIPRRDVESKIPANSEVKTSQMTAEDYAKFESMNKQSDFYGRPAKKPILNNLSPEQQRHRAKMRYEKEENGMAHKSKYSHVTKELLEKEFASGKSMGQIEREQGMKVNSLPYIMKKHGVVNPNGRGNRVTKQVETAQNSKSSVNNPKLICLYIPVIDGGWKPSEQSAKVLEELQEFHKEILDGGRRIEEASELYDLIQSYIGLIRTELLDLIDQSEVDTHLDRFFTRNNELHISKIQRYAVERDWTMINE